ncbi:MAG: DUF1905 domain-containing protein [Chitinophagaceae bacterium]
MNSFTAKIYKIGINPYVLLPAAVLKELFKEAGKNKGPIPVHGTLNGHPFIQHLIKYSGKWRLYLNTPMRKGAGIDVGDMANVKIEYDPEKRIIPVHPKLQSAFNQNKKAKAVFDKLIPSRQKEIVRYIGNLKSDEAIEKNIKRAIAFLSGKERFIGRDKP